MHMITSMARRPNASTRSEPVESSGACKDKELGAWALEQQGRVINEWRWEVEALRSLVILPWITQYHFADMLQARKIDKLLMFISFSNGNGSAFENRSDSGYPFASAMYKDNAVGNVVAETGRDLVFGTTTRLSGLSMPFPLCALTLKGEVRRSPEQSTERKGKFVWRAYSRRALDCAYAFSHRARCTKTTLLETW